MAGAHGPHVTSVHPGARRMTISPLILTEGTVAHEEFDQPRRGVARTPGRLPLPRPVFIRWYFGRPCCELCQKIIPRPKGRTPELETEP